jgi:hypothetical protein
LSTANGGDLLRHLGRVRYIPKIQRASRSLLKLVPVFG